MVIFHDGPPADFAPRSAPRRPSGSIGCYVPHYIPPAMTSLERLALVRDRAMRIWEIRMQVVITQKMKTLHRC